MAIPSTINPTQTTKPRAPISGITSGLTINNSAGGQNQQPKSLLGVAPVPTGSNPNSGITSMPETWTAKRDRENAIQKLSGAAVAPAQETWAATRERENAALMQKATTSAAIQPIAAAIAQAIPTTPAPMSPPATTTAQNTPTAGSAFASSLDGTASESRQGMAKGGIAGLIPGQIDPTVADDITINAKKGEYVVPQEVVTYFGAKYFSDLVAKARKVLGFPQGTGPKSPNEPDNIGRMDKPLLRGIADISGMAAGGLIDTINESVAASKAELERNTGNTGAYVQPPATPEAQPVAPERTTTQYDLGSGIPIDSTPAPPADNTFQNKILTNMGLSTIPDQPQGIATPPKTASESSADKEARIMNSRTVPTNAGITPDMVQRPSKQPGSIAALPDVPPSIGSGAMYFSDEQGRGKILDAGGGATGGFSRNEESRVRDLARTNAFEIEAAQKGADAARLSSEKATTDRINLLNDIIRVNQGNQFDGAGKIAGAQNELASITGQQILKQNAQNSANHLAGVGITAGAHVRAAEVAALGKEKAGITAHAMEVAMESNKHFNQLSNKYFDQFSKLNLPNDVSGRIMEISKDYAIAADPSSPLGLHFMKGSRNRGGFLADKTIVAAGLNRFAKQGYDLNDPGQYDKALSAVYADLQKTGKVKPVPNMYAFVDKSTVDKHELNALP